ncbi:MAG: O-antigen ligase family protein [Mariprofundales bacterium]
MTHYSWWLLCLTGLLLPFSIAASNVVFGLMLLLTLISGQWWQGGLWLRHHYPWLLRAWLGYMALLVLGLLWSPDLQWGLHVLSKYWSWLLVPAMVGLLAARPKKQESVMLFASIGLLLHLLLCTMQWFGLLPNLNPGVSSSADATGMLGRIGFGLIYGVWSAWLLHRGLHALGWQRLLCWGIALWAVVMVFLAQGRSGYLIVLLLAALLSRKLLFYHVSRWRFWLSALLVGMLLAVSVWQSDGLRHRVKWTAHSMQQAEQGNFGQSEARLVMWYGALRGWQAHPVLGVGTGGFPSLSKAMAQQYGILYDGRSYAAHPHQMYLLDLARWGPLGLLALVGFFIAWVSIGWRNMEQSPYNTLVVASGVALALHGLSAPSLEEYYGSIYGALFLAIGLAGRVAQASDKA